MEILNNILTAEWVMNLAFQSLLILVIGWLFVYLFRLRAAPLRSGISLVTMLALILLPIVSVSFTELDCIPFRTMLPFTIESTSTSMIDINYGSIKDGTEELAGNPIKGTQGILGLTGMGLAAVRAINLFGILWGLGFIFLLIWFVMGAISIRMLRKGMRRIQNPRVSHFLNLVEKTFSKRPRIQVFSSAKASYPMAVGVFKPIILIPERFLNKLTDSEIQGILLHELSHIHHKDQLTGILQRLTTALNWWNPLAYALSKAHSKAREEISDNHVLLQNDSKEYAECLINLVEKASLSRWLPVSAGMASPHIPLTERIKHILSKERIMDTKLKKSNILVMALAAFLVVGGIAGSRLTFARAEHETGIENEDLVIPVVQEKEKTDQTEEKKISKGKEVKPPKLIKKVEPTYPDEAKEAELEGAVVVEATTDEKGNVKKVKIVKGEHDILNKAAADAVKQWKYEPMLIDGIPHGIQFTVTCRFSLDDKKTSASAADEVFVKRDAPPVRAVGDVNPPNLIKKVEPIYPEAARAAGIKGTVILEVTTDIYGRVKNIKVLESIPELDRASIDAVKQWVYEPMIIDGEPKGVVFTVTCAFKLDEYKRGVKLHEPKLAFKLDEPVRAVGDIKPPKLIKKVEPIYPEAARAEGIKGTVILEVTTDIYGRVKNIKVLESIPELDRASIDAVKQWIYEPALIDGKPKGVIFTVTVTFHLK
jgi:TonB family protein